MQSGSNKKEAGKGQTDRALLAVYSSDKRWRDRSPPKALNPCVLVCVCLRERVRKRERVREHVCISAWLGKNERGCDLFAFSPPVPGYRLAERKQQARGKSPKTNKTKHPLLWVHPKGIAGTPVQLDTTTLSIIIPNETHVAKYHNETFSYIHAQLIAFGSEETLKFFLMTPFI